MTDDTGRIYLYCVIRDSGPLAVDAPPVSGQGTVYPITDGGLTAVVSDGGLPKYELTRTNVRAHQAVLDCVLPSADVLPARLGTTLPAADDVVENLLRERRGELLSLLDKVAGRVELGLKVSWADLQDAFREVVAGDAGLRALRDRLAARRGAAPYAAQLELGDRAGQALAAARAREADRVIAALAPCAADVRRNDPMSDLMILNAAFLVGRRERRAFEEAVEALDRADTGRLRFMLAGPLPAYNFVALTVVSRAAAGSLGG